MGGFCLVKNFYQPLYKIREKRNTVIFTACGVDEASRWQRYENKWNDSTEIWNQEVSEEKIDSEENSLQRVKGDEAIAIVFCED